MSRIIIYPSEIKGDVNIVSSKSLSHRYLIAASLAKGESKITNVLKSKDLDATINVLKNLCVDISSKDDINYLVRSNGLNPTDKTLDVYESGSTLRFIIPLLWLFSNESSIKMQEGLSVRPLTIYNDIANKYQYKLTKLNNQLKVSGPLKSGVYEIDGSISSQFISGLLFALPLVNGDSKIIIKNHLASKSYIDLTLDVLDKTGIKIEINRNEFIIKGNQNYQAIDTEIEGDYSAAAFFIVLAILKNIEFTINNLSEKSLQGDKEILNIIKKMGVKYSFNGNKLTIYKHETLNAPVIDLMNIPDLGPILMVLASSIDSVTVFKNISRLKIKESDRLQAIKNNLEKQGVIFNIQEEELFITGVKSFKGNQVFDTYNDHRIAMALAVYGLCSENEVILNDYTVVEKSYPCFFEDIKNIGGIVKND
ncbi:3-phosphoshikimate 1-carboxyvinyltransferase [Haploplasma axanthum]|uniref:3-phosphoshikimate 1-carboxyvinyltransferase n=1 Tax=Haploplasma axanthum TaxID=29552 RepID=A0A449BD42_HAPAX|nr:3-phosphoshikimate 1-carboxyvinyltransferase [Haploplasma axanthum]VEU80348.1 3-phosphoshikimate 1-carboxyvinyltransferase [Haploplasma axanthum]